MKRIILIFFILNLLNLEAQDADSLLAVAQKLPNDTSRVNLFYGQGFAYRAIDAQYSYDCARLAEQFALRCGQPYYIAKADNLLGILFYRKGDLVSALSFHKKALELRKDINDKRGIALSQANLGNIYSDLARYKQAESAYLEALAINNELNLQKQVDNCLLNLGVLSMELKAINIAENYFLRALKNAEQRTDYEVQATCLNNLAVINISRQNYDAAIANSNNSIKIKNLMDNEMEMADSYLNLSVAYIYKKDALHALENLLIADSVISKFDYLQARIQALKTRADYYRLENNFEPAFAALQNYEQLKDSVAKVNKLAGEADFTEAAAVQVKDEHQQKFPFIYFNILVIILLASVIFIFKNKR